MTRFRTKLTLADPISVTSLVRDTGFFSQEEIDIAHELTVEALMKGEASGYHFVFAEPAAAIDSNLSSLGYACYGPIPGTRASFDLYWIVVAQKQQGAGIGRELLAYVEQSVSSLGGTRLYADTSSRPQYAPTRAFYERCGFNQAAFLEDFYAEDDGKVIYVKSGL